MEIEDGFDELLAEISEPSSSKKIKVDEISAQAGWHLRVYFLIYSKNSLSK